MARAAQISGVLRDAAGRAMAGRALTLTNVDDARGLRLRTVTDRRGRYRFTGLPAGRYRTLAGESPLGTPTDVTAGLPVVRDLMAGALSTAGDDAAAGDPVVAADGGAPADSGLPVGGVANVSGPTTLIQSLTSSVLPGGAVTTDSLPTSGLAAGLLGH
jgi:hypothetical protein